MTPTTRLTIGSVTVRAIDLALERPVETAAGVMATTPLVLIDVRTGEGVVGRSYVRCYTPLALQPLAALVRAVGDALAGGTAAPLAVDDRMRRMFRLAGPQGLAGMAMAGIDMALWDAHAVAVGLPLVTLLGGEPGPVPAYASLRSMDARRATAEAEELAARGFTAFKVKVGGRPLEADREVIRGLRSVIGPDARLMVDTFPELSSHLLAVTPGAAYLEYLDHARPVLTSPVRVQDGHVWTSEEPGSGIAWDETAVRRLGS